MSRWDLYFLVGDSDTVIFFLPICLFYAQKVSQLLFVKLKWERDIHGISICTNAPIISHLLLAYDRFLFFRAEEREAFMMKHILETYEKASAKQLASINLKFIIVGVWPTLLKTLSHPSSTYMLLQIPVSFWGYHPWLVEVKKQLLALLRTTIGTK